MSRCCAAHALCGRSLPGRRANSRRVGAGFCRGCLRACDLTIVGQPQDWIGELGEYPAISVLAQGEGLTYQWFVKNPGAANFGAGSVKKASYSITMTAANDGRQVYCKVTDAYGNSVTTDIVTLSIG